MKKLIITLIVLAVVAGSVGAYYKYRDNGVEVKISTLPVNRGDIVDSVGATGTVQAVTTVQVGTQVSGTIKALYADFNSIVRKGQLVAELDPALLQTQIEQSRANLIRSQADADRLRITVEDARNKLKRAEGLAARKLLSPQDLEASQVSVRAAEAQLKSSEAGTVQSQASLNQAEVNLQHAVIQAPIDGIVISRNVDVGQTVAASMNAPTLFIIAADLTKMQVNANVDESDVGRIRPGQHVRFRVDAYPTEEFTGTLNQVRLQPIVSQNVVTYATVIDVPNPELKLKPGMTANVTIEIARRVDAIRVPNAALRFRPNADTFAALNLPVPSDLVQRGGFGAGTGQRGGGPQAIGAATSGPASPATSAAPQGNRPGQSTSTPAQSQTSGQTPPSPSRGMGAGQGPGTGQQGVGAGRGQGSGEQGFGGGGRGGRSGDMATGVFAQGAQAQQTIANRPAAQTIDQLFGPLPVVETSGRAWIRAAAQLKAVRLRLGITDGTYTELLSGEVSPGQELVTAVITPAQAAAAATRSPLMPGGPGQRPGGQPGFGGGRGGGGR
ncbi:MAG: efflux RND transporter periplasmic adaptor subunit [Acidobacteriota bacterium]